MNRNNYSKWQRDKSMSSFSFLSNFKHTIILDLEQQNDEIQQDLRYLAFERMRFTQYEQFSNLFRLKIEENRKAKWQKYNNNKLKSNVSAVSQSSISFEDFRIIR